MANQKIINFLGKSVDFGIDFLYLVKDHVEKDKDSEDIEAEYPDLPCWNIKELQEIFVSIYRCHKESILSFEELLVILKPACEKNISIRKVENLVSAFAEFDQLCPFMLREEWDTAMQKGLGNKLYKRKSGGSIGDCQIRVKNNEYIYRNRKWIKNAMD